MKNECSMCDGTSYSEFQSNIRKMIDKVGLYNLGVRGEGEPSFTYTIGASEKHGFELICIGLPPHQAATMFNQIVLGYLAEGNTLELNVPDDRWSNLPVMFKECDDALAREYAVQAFQFYRPASFRLIQMVLSDRNGRLPNDPNFDHEHMSKFQKLLYNSTH